jgi:hypothetical protein
MPEIVGKQIGPVGYGLMGKYMVVENLNGSCVVADKETGLTWRPNPVSEDQAFEAMRAALANGSNFVSEHLEQFLTFRLVLSSRWSPLKEVSWEREVMSSCPHIVSQATIKTCKANF